MSQSEGSTPHTVHHGEPPRGKALFVLSFAALGVVFGDIGTSPLYALKECFRGPYGVPLTPENVLGVLSLIFWSLNILISFKYLVHMLRADNRGEGGVIALLALVKPNGKERFGRWLLVAVGLFGATMLYGDGAITPAISVLSAVDGLAVASDKLEPFVLWISLAIIIGLFSVQRRGTSFVGSFFGAITIVWFFSIALLGIRGIILEPGVLVAMSPHHAVGFFLRDPGVAFMVLAAVVLVVTGGEALYADMGHFGRRPIRVAWLCVVLPALVLNYFGQGALLLSNPSAIVNPFYELVPAWALYPMTGIATAAAISASQALISGSFSLTQQAMQLGYVPRLQILHTSRSQVGQIYIPAVNWTLMVVCVLLVLGFRDADSLAGTYGVAVTMTMMTSTFLFCAIAGRRFGWSRLQVLAFGIGLLLIEGTFLAANLTKIPHGGWVPLGIGVAVFTMMTTWRRGRALLNVKLREGAMPLDLMISDVGAKLHRVSGTAVFMTSDPTGAPPVLLHHLKHNKVLHERVILMSIVNHLVPQMEPDERVEITRLEHGFFVVRVHYGFMETPDMPTIVEMLAAHDMKLTIRDTSFYLGRETIIPAKHAPGSKPGWFDGRMTTWRKRLFVVMANNARPATAFFNLPPNRVVEMGAQIQI
ncbi:MAG: potassium transporter Kup [Gemmatimonadales bacterium]|nr:potassium transporter Kup [Gemmatimonadales bacterium]